MRVLITLILISPLILIAQTKSAEDFQKEINEQYTNPLESPLLKTDLEQFKGLPFFPIDSTFRVTANLKRTPNAEVFKMKTTTARRPEYMVYGIATFTLKDKEYQLNIYKSYGEQEPEYEDYLFLPFKDFTNGEETYGGGRFIDLRIPEGEEIIIDFNQAYNPYCAYNHAYSCPIVPSENSLNVEIEAGVKYIKNH